MASPKTLKPSPGVCRAAASEIDQRGGSINQTIPKTNCGGKASPQKGDRADIGHAIRVRIGDAELTRIEYRGQWVVTFAMVDKVHGRAAGTAGRVYRDNRSRFVEGDDFFVAKLDEFRRAFPEAAPARGGGDMTLITRRGYLKIVKSLNDDMAWAVFEEMVERYFAVERIVGAAPSIQPGRADAREARLFFRHALSIAAMAGLEGNQRLLAANKAMRSQLGVDQLAMLGIAALPAPEQEALLTPTDIGRQLGGLKPTGVNRLLAAHGFQVSGRDHKGRTFWEPTSKGLAAGAHMVDVERGNGTGSARQLRWASGIVPVLRDLMTTSQTGARA